jgi:inorganic pyrophosphatase
VARCIAMAKQRKSGFADPIGGEQGTKKRTERNDRIVLVESDNHSYSHVRRIEELGKEFAQELDAVLSKFKSE